MEAAPISALHACIVHRALRGGRLRGRAVPWDQQHREDVGGRPLALAGCRSARSPGRWATTGTCTSSWWASAPVAPADMTAKGRGRLCVSNDDTTRRPDVGDRLSPGDTAPDFTLPDDTGSPVTLGDLRGGKVIVYFYPAAMTPGCTTQACDFSDSLAALQAAGYTVLGISKDSPSKLAKFRERDGLTITLLSDPDLAVHHAYGAYGRKLLYGKEVEGVIRSTFVVDEKGKIELAQY